MPRPDSVPEPWRSFLQELDEAVGGEVRLVCMGGFVITQLYGFSRSTVDIDTLSIVPRDEAAIIRGMGCQGGPLHAKYKIYLDFVAVASVPEDYEERLREMYPQALGHLRLFALDPYDLALSNSRLRIFRRGRAARHAPQQRGDETFLSAGVDSPGSRAPRTREPRNVPGTRPVTNS